MNITNELNSGEDRYQGKSCDGCEKFYKYVLALLEEPNWGNSYELCRSCVKIRKENGRPNLEGLREILREKGVIK